MFMSAINVCIKTMPLLLHLQESPMAYLMGNGCLVGLEILVKGGTWGNGEMQLTSVEVCAYDTVYGPVL
jgi:hypothetical protein